jgi:tRNA threonylcarbamoyl adenosine modification protein (Sua5/YciO/YrdC/YwlC family)
MKHTAHLAWDLGDTRGTVAVRMPDHEIAIELISRTGPLATSSANRSGHEPATTMMDARLQLGAAVAVYLDGGPSGEPVASSIVDLTGERPRVLRAGALDLERLREIAPEIEAAPTT